ncbi:MAG: hypothetical protein QXX41_00230 [Nitrososphaerota archaeon]
MSKIERFKLGKGVTSKIPGTEYEFTRKYLEVEVKLPEQLTEEGFHEAVLKAEYLLDQHIQPTETEAIPKLDIAEIQSLPWTSYQTKQACTRPDEAGWIWSDPSRHEEGKMEVVKNLNAAIERAPKHKLQLGDMIYTWSGPKEDPTLFISRRPASKKA